MNIYLVGGAVRDQLLGLPVVERDWVVVGATPSEMLAEGYKPADSLFPVFLHPKTAEEYALARRETKSGEGYRGFEVYCGPDVTLEQDLLRRDLTINAMAQGEDGELIDPYRGRDDLDEGRLRHVSPAFTEDPLRVIRVARFAAKLGRFGFRLAHSTHRLMKAMVENGDMAHLTAERVWRETMKAMATEQPWRFFEVLHRCAALTALLPVLADAMAGDAAHAATSDSAPIAALKRMTAVSDDPAARLLAALWCCVTNEHDAETLIDQLRADRDVAGMLRKAAAGNVLCEQSVRGDVEALVQLIGIWRGWSRNEDFARLVRICDAQYEHPVVGPLLDVALPAAQGVSVDQLKAQGFAGAELGRQLESARHDVIRQALVGAGLVT